MQIINVVKRAEGGGIPPVLNSVLPEGVCREISGACVSYGVLEEIRLRAGRRCSVVISGRNVMLSSILSAAELSGVLVRMCDGSLYAYSDTINQGYITLSGGLRVGVCGRATCEGSRIIGVHDIGSLCIRIPHKPRRVGGKICALLRGSGLARGILIFAPPGVGKTTLLRGVIGNLSSGDEPLRCVVIDTRGELSFANDAENLCIDILSGYPRREGIEIATRCLNPQVLICDEIGDYEEAFSLVSSHNCGVPLIASAHAGTLSELLTRSGIRLLHEARIFGAYVRISRTGGMDFSYDISMWEEADRLCLQS